MRLPHPLYGLYERRLAASLPEDGLPRHVGVILDGNRRWARSVGESTAHGHQAGADKIADLLEWSEDIGVEVVTLWMLSTDNLERSRRRARAAARDHRGRRRRARGDRAVAHPGGRRRSSCCPTTRSKALAGRAGRDRATCVGAARQRRGRVRRSTRDRRRREGVPARARGRRVEASTSWPRRFDVEHIAEHLYTKGQPDPDLVIRTSGEQRLGGFLLWQSAHSEFYFCEAYWPDFRRVDFLRAVRAYAARERRGGR